MFPEPCRTFPENAASDLFRRCLDENTRHSKTRHSAWDEFTRRYERRLRATLRKTFGPKRIEADVEDCLQDLYLRLLSLDGEAFRGRTEWELDCYLDQMARNLVRDRRRLARGERRRWQSVRAREAGFHVSTLRPVQERRIIARQRLGGYLRCCRRMLEVSGQRVALVEGYESREIARRLGGLITAPQIDAMIHRLRRRLAQRGIPIRRRGRAGAAPGHLSRRGR